jgi:hypothetical protein
LVNKEGETNIEIRNNERRNEDKNFKWQNGRDNSTLTPSSLLEVLRRFRGMLYPYEG